MALLAMRLTFRTLPFLLLGFCGPLWAGQEGVVAPNAAPRRSELRSAVEAHRLSVRDQVRHEDAVAGRRLTASERAELREQLREQWVSGQHSPAESLPPERIAPTPVADAAPQAAQPPRARSQRQ